MFIGLLLRAMKSDVNLKRVCAFSKRLLQVCNAFSPFSASSCAGCFPPSFIFLLFEQFFG